MTKFWLDFDWKIFTPMNLKVGTWPKFKAPTNINFTTKKYAGACKWLPPFCLFTFYKKREQPLIFYQLKIILYSKLVLLLRNLCRCSINWIKKFGIGIIFRSFLIGIFWRFWVGLTISPRIVSCGLFRVYMLYIIKLFSWNSAQLVGNQLEEIFPVCLDFFEAMKWI